MHWVVNWISASLRLCCTKETKMFFVVLWRFMRHFLNVFDDVLAICDRNHSWVGKVVQKLSIKWLSKHMGQLGYFGGFFNNILSKSIKLSQIQKVPRLQKLLPKNVLKKPKPEKYLPEFGRSLNANILRHRIKSMRNRAKRPEKARAKQKFNP